MANTKKEILLALDAGFSNCKMVVNEKIFSIPFSIQDITDDADCYELRRIEDDYVRCFRNDHIFLCGEVAKTYSLSSDHAKNNKTTMEAFSTMERYNMPLFKDALQAFVAYALEMAREVTREGKGPVFSPNDIVSEDNPGGWSIILGLALPHKHTDMLIPVLESQIKEGVDIEIAIGLHNTTHYKFKYSAVYFNSQVVCMLINESVTDDIEDFQGEDDLYNYLPALVIDGGYKTVGEFLFGADQSIIGDDSNTEYAMLNVNQKVADELNLVRPGYAEYQIDEMCARKEVVRYVNSETGKVESLDVCAIREKYIKEFAEEYISHLCKKYDNLLDVKMILIGGGTGGLYFPYFEDWCAKNREYLSGRVILAGQKPFFGSKCGPVNAIVAGMYKDILMQRMD